MTKQEEYYQMATNWVKEYLSNNETLLNYKSFDGITIHDTHKTLKVWLDRLENSQGSEKMASYVRIKKFKDYLNKQNGN